MRLIAPMLRALRRDIRGVAMVEFAYALPLLIAVGLVGMEMANYVRAHMLVSEIGMRVADNAARVRDSISEADVNELFIGAKLMGDGIEFGRKGRIILSSVEQNAAKNGQWIRWQRCYGVKNKAPSYGTQGKGQNDSSLPAIGPPGNQIAAMSGTAVMFVEVSYDYKPLIGDWLIGQKTINYVGAYNVRQRVDQVIKSGGLASSAWSTCDKFTA